ncbi:hypothetical protein, partial [Burkholderia multivorans]|uniref:hypothetical protein n=1 Tax=Burkholderia multivorans TaxID=87883 RepID=UPI0019D2EE7E
MKNRNLVAPAAVLLFALTASGLSYADTEPKPASNIVATTRCDAASFAKSDASYRQGCRRMFAREPRPSVQTSPQAAADFAS